MSIVLDGTNGIDSPDLTISGTGARITGDFSNATFSNRVAFQTNTANAFTVVNILPNGTSLSSAINLFNNSDPTNASRAILTMSGTEAGFQSAITGTGTYLPMTFYTGGSERMRIDTSGNVGIGTTSTAYKMTVAGAGTGYKTSYFDDTDAAYLFQGSGRGVNLARGQYQNSSGTSIAGATSGANINFSDTFFSFSTFLALQLELLFHLELLGFLTLQRMETFLLTQVMVRLQLLMDVELG